MSSNTIPSLNNMLDFDPNDFDVSWFELLNSFTVATEKLSSHVIKQSEQMGSRVRNESSKIKKYAKEHGLETERLKKLSRNLHRNISKFETKLSETLVMSRTEKLWYTASLMGIAFIGAVLVAKPEIMHIVYTSVLVVLLPLRFFTYFKQNYHFYLADLCYFVTFIDLLYIWAWPDSEFLWIASYAFSFGSLAFAIIAWRNSLVLHSIDKTTSTAIHFLPPLVFHCINHLISPEYRSVRFPAAGEVHTWHTFSSVTVTTAVYFVWQSLYHFFITWKQKDRIAAGQVTSFEFLRRAYKDTKLGKLVNGLPGFLPVVAFTLIQFSFQLFTMMFCPVWYRSRQLSSLFLLVLFVSAAYNGATYYIDVFGQRFHKELQKLQQEIDEMSPEPSSNSRQAPATATATATASARDNNSTGDTDGKRVE